MVECGSFKDKSSSHSYLLQDSMIQKMMVMEIGLRHCVTVRQQDLGFAQRLGFFALVMSAISWQREGVFLSRLSN